MLKIKNSIHKVNVSPEVFTNHEGNKIQVDDEEEEEVERKNRSIHCKFLSTSRALFQYLYASTNIQNV